MEQFKKYLRYNSKTYFLITTGTKGEMLTVRVALHLREPEVVEFPFSGTIGGKVGLYALDADCISKKIQSKFDALNALAEKCHLRTNSSQIGKRSAESVQVLLVRKESEAQEEMKRDNKFAEPISPPKPAKVEVEKPDVTWDEEDMGQQPLNLIQFLRQHKLESKVIHFSQEEQEERVSKFKKQYLNAATDMLTALKILFPEVNGNEFVDIMKNLKIDPISPAKFK